jgi:putative PIN family toxin of toxin-antitoxin system
MLYFQAAAREHGPAAACLRLAEEGIIALHVSKDVIEEINDVLFRPKIRRKFTTLTDIRVQQFLERLATTAKLVEGVARQLYFERDRKDEKYLNLALAAGTQFLVSRDKDLLDLNLE